MNYYVSDGSICKKFCMDVAKLYPYVPVEIKQLGNLFYFKFWSLDNSELRFLSSFNFRRTAVSYLAPKDYPKDGEFNKEYLANITQKNGVFKNGCNYLKKWLQ